MPAVAHAIPAPKREHRLVRVFAALCDNKHQGIVKVPALLGNGQDPANNLYWGAAYGVKTFLRRSPHWEPATPARGDSPDILDRAAFRLKGSDVVVEADAYDGAHMKEALLDFFAADADLVCFVGHNGLMDLSIDPPPRATRSARVVLACKSEAYFRPLLGESLLVATTGLMAPEAYTLDAIVRSWAAGDPPATVRDKAAEAYARYQKCSPAASKRLFVVCGQKTETIRR